MFTVRNFLVALALCVMSCYNSPEYSIPPRSREVNGYQFRYYINKPAFFKDWNVC